MKSIQGKFILSSLLGIVLCVACVGGFGLWTAMRAQQSSSDQIITLTCREEANQLDKALLSIESSVGSCADIIGDELAEADSLDDVTRTRELVAQAERIMGSIAGHTTGLYAYYLRLDPKLSPQETGFFYSRRGRDEQFREQEPTDIYAFDPNDTEHVGWYFLPKERGEAVWLDPYLNRNIDVYMISYVVPLYVQGSFCGVVGMDVDFNVITSLVRRIRPYETSRASLVSTEGREYFHPDHAGVSDITDEVGELSSLVGELPLLATGESTEIHTFVHDGVERKVGCCRLLNGMVLMLSVETSEVVRPVTRLFATTLAFGALICALSAVVVTCLSRRITRPLNQLVGVANQISEGDLDVELPRATSDEVGVLSRTLDVTVGKLREHIEGMSAKAYRDDLTGVANKAAYTEAVRRLEDSVPGAGETFAIMVCDLNDLKRINDRCGHAQGDDYLRSAATMIAETFAHSTVYRIGGDEFALILQGHDLTHAWELIDELDARMEAAGRDERPWMSVSIAMGLAVRDSEEESVDDVFARADAAMYQNKRRMKGLEQGTHDPGSSDDVLQ